MPDGSNRINPASTNPASTDSFSPGLSPGWPDGYVPSAAEWNSWWAQKLDVDSQWAISGPYLSLKGGTMTGPLYLYGPPKEPMEAVTKAYVDANIGHPSDLDPLMNQKLASPGVSPMVSRQDHVHPTDITLAPIFSPGFQGTPSMPIGTIGITQTKGDNSAHLATTQFVQQAISGFVTSWNGRGGAVNMSGADIMLAGGALINGPAFTGDPTAPNPPPNDNDNSLATTAWVRATIASSGGGGGGGGGATVTLSDTPPVAPMPGALWFDTVAAQMYIYYPDPNSAAFVPVVNQEGSGGASVDTSLFVDNGPDTNGIILPMYFYPNDPFNDPVFLHLLDSIRANHNVPTIVIVSIGSPGGPGTTYDAVWGTAITRLKAAGARVLAYVDTNYGNRDPNLVRGDIDTWVALYGPPPSNPWTDYSSAAQGIFFDQFAYSTTNGVGADNVALYQSYYQYAYSKGFHYVVGNTGGDEQASWYKLSPAVADMIVMWENSTWPTKSTLEGYAPDGHSYFTWKWNGVLIHSASSLDTTNLTLTRKYAKWVYVTDGLYSGGASNPWGKLSAYLDQLYAALKS